MKKKIKKMINRINSVEKQWREASRKSRSAKGAQSLAYAVSAENLAREAERLACLLDYLIEQAERAQGRKGKEQALSAFNLIVGALIFVGLFSLQGLAFASLV